MKNDLYDTITSQLVELLNKGVAPWRCGFLTDIGSPKNLETGKPYRGLNVFLLTATACLRGYGSAYWLTFQQAKARGGRIRSGEKSTPVLFWKQLEVADSKTGDKERIPVSRYYRVFNLQQCEGIAAPEPIDTKASFDPIAEADRILLNYTNSPAVDCTGNQAFYRPATDTVHMPPPQSLPFSTDYYATFFHELAHSTGHSKRLNRGLDTQTPPFGSPDYGREELIAEMAAAFLCAEAGIAPCVIENQAAYLAGWLQAIRQDKRLLISAAGAAQKAADWILGLQPIPPAQLAGMGSPSTKGCHDLVRVEE